MVWSAIESAASGDTELRPLDRKSDIAAKAFEWPPADEVDRDLELASEDLAAPQHPLALTASAVGASRESNPPLNPPTPPRQEEPRVAPRRVIQQRAAGSKAPPRETPAEAWLRTRAVPLALTVLALTAVLEGAYILATTENRFFRVSDSRRSNPGSASTSSTTSSQGATEPSAAPVPKQFAAVVPNDIVSAVRTSGDRRDGAPAAKGRLVIRSEPAGAQVLIDGRPYGVTPMTLGNVVAGAHLIVLKRDGVELRQTVRVEPGSTVSVVAPLKPGGLPSGWVAIASPIEVDLFENGALLGTSRSRQIMLEAGTHTLQLVNEQIGFQQTQQVRVESGKVERIAVELPPTTIHLNATPWAEVWIDGKSVGETPIGNLPIAIGPHEVVFRHPELGERVVSTVVKAGVPTRLTADLRR